MTDYAAAGQRVIQAYNDKDFDLLGQLLAKDLDFAHFNRNAVHNSSAPLIEEMRVFAAQYAPNRQFLTPERVTVAGNIVIREAYWTGTAAIDIPGFAPKGETYKFKLCTIFRFDDAGIVVEWKDHG